MSGINHPLSQRRGSCCEPERLQLTMGCTGSKEPVGTDDVRDCFGGSSPECLLFRSSLLHMPCKVSVSLHRCCTSRMYRLAQAPDDDWDSDEDAQAPSVSTGKFRRARDSVVVARTSKNSHFSDAQSASHSTATRFRRVPRDSIVVTKVRACHASPGGGKGAEKRLCTAAFACFADA